MMGYYMYNLMATEEGLLVVHELKLAINTTKADLICMYVNHYPSALGFFFHFELFSIMQIKVKISKKST